MEPKHAVQMPHSAITPAHFPFRSPNIRNHNTALRGRKLCQIFPLPTINTHSKDALSKGMVMC